MTEQNIIRKITDTVNNSVGFKVFTIFMLILVLMIPGAMIQSMIWERNSRKEGAVREISSKWGEKQTVSGPVITIPYKEYYEDDKGKIKYSIHYIHFLPDDIDIKGQVFPEIRYRGIYQAVLYNSKIEIAGSFPQMPLEEINIPPENIIWSGAYVCLGMSDMSGIRDQIDAKLGKMPVTLNPGIESSDVMASGVSTKIPLRQNSGKLLFQFSLNLNGSGQLFFVPLGKMNTVSLSSSWSSPSFDGAFLPEQRQIDDKGFKAKWKVLHLNRNYPQVWKSKHQTESSAFGVNFFVPVDLYQKTTRTAKYSLMFIVFTFMSFFFSEVMNKERLHPIQYLFVGLALTVFYALLLSISEHLNFDIAYIISGAAVITLITGYSISILKKRKLSLMVGGILFILYGYLYFVLQMEDYALLMGSIGLFAALSIVMHTTRKIDWYLLKLDSRDN